MGFKSFYHLFRLISVLFCSLVLVACGGGGGGSSENVTGSGTSVALGGSAVKGPLANAAVAIYLIDTSQSNLQGDLVTTGSTDSAAQFSGISLNPEQAPYLMVVTADADTIDITTGLAPSISALKSVITESSLDVNSNPSQSVFATPLTSMAVEILSATPGVMETNFSAGLQNAENQVKTVLGFGLDTDVDIFTTPPILTAETDTAEEQQEVAEYRLAIEALSAVLIDIAGETTAGDSAQEVLELLARDLVDGQLDATDGSGAIGELNGYDIEQLDDTDVSSLNVPGTEVSVNDIEQILVSDTDTTGVSQELSNTVDVTGSPPVLVADTDLDGIGDDVDNCPSIANSDQININGNQVGDACDAAPIVAGAIQVEVDEDGTVIIDLAQNVTDADNVTSQLSFSVAGQALDGSNYSFSPQSNVNGAVTFTYSVSDLVSQSVGTVIVTVAPQNDPGSLEVSGTASEDETLTAVISDVDGFNEASVSYQWFANGGVIQGATGATLLLTQSEVGTNINVSASYVDDDQTLESLESGSTSSVANVNDAPTGTVSVSGNPRVGQTLSAVVDISDEDGLGDFSYSWTADGIPVSESESYALQEADLSATIVLTVSYTDSFQNQESVQSEGISVMSALSEDASGLVGIWSAEVGEDEFGNDIFFMNDGDYYAIQREEIDGFIGYEYGLFDLQNDIITVTTLDNNDGQALLCESESDQTCESLEISATVLNDDLTLMLGEENISYSRQTFSSSEIEGIWEGSDEPIVFVFSPNGEYFAVQRESGAGVSGYEFGTYSLGINSDALTIATFDNNDGTELFCTADQDMETGCSSLEFAVAIDASTLTLELNNRSVVLLNRNR